MACFKRITALLRRRTMPAAPTDLPRSCYVQWQIVVWLLALISAAPAISSAQAAEGEPSMMVLPGWRCATDAGRLVVPAYVKPKGYQFTDDKRPEPVYRACIFINFIDDKAVYKVLPFTATVGGVLPEPPFRLIDWSHDSNYLVYPGEVGKDGDWALGPVWHDFERDNFVVQEQLTVGRHCLIRISPSGRYVLIAKNPFDERDWNWVFSIWEPSTGKLREVLRCARAIWGHPSMSTAWSADEKSFYVAVGIRNESSTVQTWRLAECEVDASRPYTPETAHVLFTLLNNGVDRHRQQLQYNMFNVDRTLQILTVNQKPERLLFYRGDTASYWQLNVETGDKKEEFVSPFFRTQEFSRPLRINDEGEVIDDDGVSVIRDGLSVAREWDFNGSEFAMVKHERREDDVVSFIVVIDPHRPEEAKPATLPNSDEPQWMDREWLAYRQFTHGIIEEGMPWELHAVNVRTGEKRVLVSTALQRQIASDILKNAPGNVHSK